MKLIVTCRELRYDRKSYLRGTIFEAPEKDAKNIDLLKRIGKVSDAPKVPTTPLREVATMAPPPAPEPKAEAAADETEAPRPFRRYRTRRLAAED